MRTACPSGSRRSAFSRTTRPPTMKVWTSCSVILCWLRTSLKRGQTVRPVYLPVTENENERFYDFYTREEYAPRPDD